ncbi:hypothetical protein PVAND_011678 [Polypedilum vanderplanki]|uniref:Solute carrier organic anion transporter family member n=1 Tax=Polypedilum vanderplanki TaxID=319348 RepID=A0A9J6CKC6_POLVA|nr:hypothetical protein PVAND_011678 [Polypedilum vanderplanki]
MNGSNEAGSFNNDHNDLPLIKDSYAQKPVIAIKTTNSNSNINNNYTDYRMDIKGNGNDKMRAEEDPLTGPRQNKVTDNSLQKLKWRRRFASTNFFMVIFLLAYVLQGCYFTYFVSVITTIEKLFHIKSATIALLLNFSEVGQIATSLILTYFAGRGHRPRWIAFGMLLFSISALGSLSPHFIFGNRLYQQQSNVILPSTIVSNKTTSNLEHLNDFMIITTMKSNESELNLCLAENLYKNDTTASSCNASEEKTKDDDIKRYVLIILAVSLLGIGIGQTAIATLGIPYIDDNVKSKQSPLYMAITIGVRILGPAIGYYLGSLCMRISYDLTMSKSHTDSNFIGAWYLGLLLVATSMFFASLVMFTFPKNLRNNKTTKVQPAPSDTKNNKTDDKCMDMELDVITNEPQSKLTDFAKTIKRQLRNDILIFRTLSAVFHLLPITGLYVFLPKYLETQFHMSPHSTTFISGTFGILVMGVGIFITGVISVKFPLSARKVSLWIAFTALLTAFGMFILAFLGCPIDNYKGLTENPNGSFGNSLEFLPPCNTSTMCGCNNKTFAPVCGSDGMNYYSACHAGCSKAFDENGKIIYEGCTCIESSIVHNTPTVSGFCENNACDNKLIIFIIVFALTVFIHSTSEVGGMLIIMRCTHPNDKAMAMGIVQFSIGLLSNIPCPNIYGRIIDATCIVWTDICGKHGHCVFYNSDTFRRLFFGVSCAIMLVAFVMDIIVYLKSHRIDIDPEGNEAVEKKETSHDEGDENLLKLRKLSQDVDDEQHTKIGI